MTVPRFAERRVVLPGPADPGATLRLSSMGPRDPTARRQGNGLWRACRTPSGPVTFVIEPVAPEVVRVRAWGPGAERLVERSPALVGAHDRPESLVPRHRIVARLVERLPGLRLGRAPSLFEALVGIVLQQRVTWREASSAWVGLVRRYGEAAPGPLPGLRLAPPARVFARLPPTAFDPLGVERRRADTIRRLAAVAARLDDLADAPWNEARVKLASIPGVGPWTVGMTLGAALGDPDAVVLGDAHLPNVVAWGLAREARADDARMLDLLRAYEGQRWRVVRLLVAGGVAAPRRGPRHGPRPLSDR